MRDLPLPTQFSILARARTKRMKKKKCQKIFFLFSLWMVGLIAYIINNNTMRCSSTGAAATTAIDAARTSVSCISFWIFALRCWWMRVLLLRGWRCAFCVFISFRNLHTRTPRCANWAHNEKNSAKNPWATTKKTKWTEEKNNLTMHHHIDADVKGGDRRSCACDKRSKPKTMANYDVTQNNDDFLLSRVLCVSPRWWFPTR